MKVLWLCNIVLPELSDEFGFKKQNVGGWLTGAWSELKKCDDLQLAICVPINNPERVRDGIIDNYNYYSFATISSLSNTTIDDQVFCFRKIINEFKPDVIHVWGTEYEHSYAMAVAAKDLAKENRIIVSIQGLLEYIYPIYDTGIDAIEIKERDKNSIKFEKEEFKRRAQYERKTLKIVQNVFGRTDWDRAGVFQINQNTTYYHCGAILRSVFYTADKWDYKSCDKHTIFISQAFYPIKGFHLVLNQIASLRNDYPDLKVRISGIDLLSRENEYARLIEKKIKDLHLTGVIEFIGVLDENKMIEEYLKANVFLSPSVIENESNSICEAMILGVPVVASFVGGIGTTVEHGKSGLLYPLNAPYLMEMYIRDIFESKEITKRLSVGGIERATEFNSRKKVFAELISAYKSIKENI